MDLRDTGFADVHDHADFLHGEFLEVVESENLAFLFIQLIDGLGEESAHFGAEGDVEGIFLKAKGNARHLIVTATVAGLGVEAAEIQAAEFSQEVLEVFKIETEMSGDFGL